MGEVRKLVPPISEAQARSLKAGDEVAISGVIYTARDMAHKRLCAALDAWREVMTQPSILVMAGGTSGKFTNGESYTWNKRRKN